MLALPRQMDAGIGRVFLEKEPPRHILSLGLAGHCLRKNKQKKTKTTKVRCVFSVWDGLCQDQRNYERYHSFDYQPLFGKGARDPPPKGEEMYT